MIAFDRRGVEVGLLRVQSQGVPIDRQPALDRRLGPGGHRDQGLALADIGRGHHVLVIGLYGTLRMPVAEHSGPIDTELVPHGPNVIARSGPRNTCGHAVDHAAPSVPAALEHVTHQAVGDAGNLDQPVVGRLVVVEPFAEPNPIDIGEELHVLVGRAAREIGVRMQIDQASGPVAIHHLADPLERFPIVADVVEVQPVDADVFHQPAEPFDVVVVPPRGALIDDRRTDIAVGEVLIPGGREVADEVLAEPGISDAGEIGVAGRGQDLVTQASQGPKLDDVVGQLADRVVDLDLHVLLVAPIDVGLELLVG